MRASFFFTALSLSLAGGCGKISGDGNPPPTPDTSTWGTACHADPSGFDSPPACNGDAGSGPLNTTCQAWVDGLVSGGAAECADPPGKCVFAGLPYRPCTPGPDGDAQCQAYFQSYSKSSLAYAKCLTPGPRDGEGSYCVSADQCEITAQGWAQCWCGTNTGPGYGCSPRDGTLCLDVGGSPACAAWCR